MTKLEGIVVAAAVSTAQRVCPKAAVGLALTINSVWILALSYGAYLLGASLI
jgi:hypothetical protein